MSKQSRQGRREEREREARERYERNQAERNIKSSFQPVYDSREPDWTTGQGVGFLVALPGWLVVGLAALAAAGRPHRQRGMGAGSGCRLPHGAARHHRLQQVQTPLTQARRGPFVTCGYGPAAGEGLPLPAASPGMPHPCRTPSVG